MGFPPQFFTVLFAIPRVTGYLAHWRESLVDPDTKILRPQQDYQACPCICGTAWTLGRACMPLDCALQQLSHGSRLHAATGVARVSLLQGVWLRDFEPMDKRPKQLSKDQETLGAVPPSNAYRRAASGNWE